MSGTTSERRRWLIPIGGMVLLCALGCRGKDPILGGSGGVAPAALAAPTVTAVAPVNNATAVSVNLTVVTANFSEAMAPITGAATFTVTAAAPGVSPVGTVTLDATNRIASFTFTGPLTASTVYTGTVTGAKSLATGLALASPYVWTFTTGIVPDTTRPLVTLTIPTSVLPAATNVPTNSAITATFSEDMAPLTITPASAPATFTLTSGTPAVATAGTVSYSVVGRTATFTPTTTLVVSTLYTATVTLVATDLAGNALAGVTATPTVAANHVWTFTTAAAPDIIPPTITLTNPANLATNVAVNATVNATYSEAMNAGSIAFKLLPTSTPAGTPIVGLLSYDALTHISTFTPTSPLASNTNYTATITAATDLAGNALASGTTPNPWTFNTGIVVLPPGISLGAAGAFGIMATLEITDAGGSFINGDVSLNPGSSCGLLPAQVNGTIYINDLPVAGVSLAAKNDLLTTYTTCMALPSTATTPSGGDLGAWAPPGSTLPAGTLPPGVYTNGSTMMVSSLLTLDAGGDPNAIWVFQIGSSLTTTTPLGNIKLANGALAKNVFWVTVSDATVGVNTTFNGTIVAGRNATGQTGAVINGRILAGATNPGTIALDSNTVTVPAN